MSEDLLRILAHRVNTGKFGGEPGSVTPVRTMHVEPGYTTSILNFKGERDGKTYRVTTAHVYEVEEKA